MIMLRSMVFVVWAYGGLGMVGVLFLLPLLFSPAAGMMAIRTWARWVRLGLRLIMGTTTEVRGLENIPEGPVLVAGKHMSTYDTILPFLYLDQPVFILKRELLYYPFLGWYAMRTGMIAIDRDGGLQTLKAMTDKASRATKNGRSIVVFPEGTRKWANEATDYKPGVALLYKELNLPCVPLALNTGLCWHPKGVRRTPGKVVFEFLPPIAPGLKRRDFMSTLESEIETGTHKLVEEGRRVQSEQGISAVEAPA